MSHSNYRDVTLIVRECGERTVDSCVGLLREIFPGQPVLRVTGKSFQEVLQASLIAGAEAGRAWALCIDADVLPLPAICDFISEARALPRHFCEAQALVADKLLPSFRPAGNHLYRTSLIPYALSYIPDAGTIRPESSMIATMGEVGFPYHQSSWLVGLHDFEQAPLDIYNKAALHGYKHDYLEKEIFSVWDSLAASDSDYQVARLAFLKSLEQTNPGEVSRRCRAEEAMAALSQCGIIDKPILSCLSLEQVRLLLAHAPHNLPEARNLRLRIESDVARVVESQRAAYTCALPAWQRWWRRAMHMYPYLSSRTQEDR